MSFFAHVSELLFNNKAAEEYCSLVSGWLSAGFICGKAIPH